MPFARALPARTASRFASAHRLQATTPTGSFELIAAERFLVRLRGLAGLAGPELVPLLFPRCRSLHTFGMRTSIDVVWLELGRPASDARVIEVAEAVPPRRVARAPRGSDRGGTAALELPAGEASALGLAPTVRMTLSV